MTYFIAFLVGAIIGCGLLAWSLVKRPLPHARHPVQGFMFAAIAGGLIFGTVIWLVALAFS